MVLAKIVSKIDLGDLRQVVKDSEDLVQHQFGRFVVRAPAAVSCFGCHLAQRPSWRRGPGTSHFGTWTGPAKAHCRGNGNDETRWNFQPLSVFFGCRMLPLKYRLHGDSVENDVCQFHGVGLKSICIYLFISSWFEKFPPWNSFRIALPFGFFWLEVQPRSCFGLSLEGTSWHKPCVRASKRRRRSPCLSWKWKEPPVCDWSFMPQSHHHHHHHQCFDDCPSSKHTSRYSHLFPAFPWTEP